MTSSCFQPFLPYIIFCLIRANGPHEHYFTVSRSPLQGFPSLCARSKVGKPKAVSCMRAPKMSMCRNPTLERHQTSLAGKPGQGFKDGVRPRSCLCLECDTRKDRCVKLPPLPALAARLARRKPPNQTDMQNNVQLRLHARTCGVRAPCLGLVPVRQAAAWQRDLAKRATTNWDVSTNPHRGEQT